MFKTKKDARDVFAAIERHLPMIALRARAEVIRRSPLGSALEDAFGASFANMFGKGFE